MELNKKCTCVLFKNNLIYQVTQGKWLIGKMERRGNTIAEWIQNIKLWDYILHHINLLDYISKQNVSLLSVLMVPCYKICKLFQTLKLKKQLREGEHAAQRNRLILKAHFTIIIFKWGFQSLDLTLHGT